MRKDRFPSYVSILAGFYLKFLGSYSFSRFHFWIGGWGQNELFHFHVWGAGASRNYYTPPLDAGRVLGAGSKGSRVLGSKGRTRVEQG